MKINILILFFLVSIVGISSCNRDKTTFPATTLLGECTCSGTIALLPTPPSDDEPTLPGLVIGLKTASEEYILTHKGFWLTDTRLTIGDKTYTLENGDEIKINGIASSIQLSASQKYLELEIKTIDLITNH